MSEKKEKVEKLLPISKADREANGSLLQLYTQAKESNDPKLIKEWNKIVLKKRSTKKPRAKKELAPLPKRPTPAEKRKELIDNEMPLSVFTKFDVEEIKMKKKHWYLKVWADLILDKSYYKYKMTMQFNEQPYEDEIYDMEEELRDSLFGTERRSRAQLNKRIKEKREKMNKLKQECYTIDFLASVEELKYKDRGTMILCTIPDDIITKLNEQKSRFSYYELKLDPTYV